MVCILDISRQYPHSTVKYQAQHCSNSLGGRSFRPLTTTSDSHFVQISEFCVLRRSTLTPNPNVPLNPIAKPTHKAQKVHLQTISVVKAIVRHFNKHFHVSITTGTETGTAPRFKFIDPKPHLETVQPRKKNASSKPRFVL